MDYIMEEHMNAAVLVMFVKDDPQCITNKQTCACVHSHSPFFTALWAVATNIYSSLIYLINKLRKYLTSQPTPNYTPEMSPTLKNPKPPQPIYPLLN